MLTARATATVEHGATSRYRRGADTRDADARCPTTRCPTAVTSTPASISSMSDSDLGDVEATIVVRHLQRGLRLRATRTPRDPWLTSRCLRRRAGRTTARRSRREGSRRLPLFEASHRARRRSSGDRPAAAERLDRVGSAGDHRRRGQDRRAAGACGRRLTVPRAGRCRPNKARRAPYASSRSRRPGRTDTTSSSARSSTRSSATQSSSRAATLTGKSLGAHGRRHLCRPEAHGVEGVGEALIDGVEAWCTSCASASASTARVAR